MNKQKWLIVGLSLAMAATLGVGISACGGGKDPETPEHTHEYTKWEHSDTQHWMVCPDDGDIWAQGKVDHDFTNGDCVCGAKKPGEGGDETPDADLDTREFYVVGGGMGTLKNGTWDGPKAGFQFAKAPHKDADGNTVYTFTMELYSADEFKFIEKNAITQETDESGNNKAVWHDELVFTLPDLDVSAVTGAFARASETSDNITVQKGKDGEYEFTIRTTKDGDMKANKVEVRLVKELEPLGVESQYEMYLVGKIASKATSDWPSMIGVANVPSKCYKMELQDDEGTFAIEVELSIADQWKVWNYKVGNVNAGYYPTGMDGNLSTGGGPNGWYRVTWKVGDSDVAITHAHRYTVWDYDTEEHWKKCPQDNEKDQTTVAAHDFSNGDTCECGYKQEADPDWKIASDGTFQEYTGDFVNMTIPANLTTFPKLAYIFGLSANNTNAYDRFEKSNWEKVKSITVAPGSKSFKIENNALVSYDGTVLYLYLPYSTETSATFENVTEIKGGAFMYNSKLQSVSFPELITISGSYAFYNTTALATVSMPKLESGAAECFYSSPIVSAEFESIKVISGTMFAGCQQLTTLVFGDKLQDISTSYLVRSCKQLTSVTIKATTPPTASAFGILFMCDNVKFYVPEGSVDAYKAANKWSIYANKISAITETVTVAPVEVAMLPEKKD